MVKMLISEMLQVRPGDSTKRVGRGCRQVPGDSRGCQVKVWPRGVKGSQGVTQGGVKGSEGVDQGCQGVDPGVSRGGKGYTRGLQGCSRGFKGWQTIRTLRETRGLSVVVKTFKNSTAERVPSECRASAAWSDKPAIYFFGFTKLSASMLVVLRLIVEL